MKIISRATAEARLAHWASEMSMELLAEALMLLDPDCQVQNKEISGNSYEVNGDCFIVSTYTVDLDED